MMYINLSLFLIFTVTDCCQTIINAIKVNEYATLLRWPRLAVIYRIVSYRNASRFGIRPSACPIFFPALIGRAAHTQRDLSEAARDATSVHFRPDIHVLC